MSFIRGFSLLLSLSLCFFTINICKNNIVYLKFNSEMFLKSLVQLKL